MFIMPTRQWFIIIAYFSISYSLVAASCITYAVHYFRLLKRMRFPYVMGFDQNWLILQVVLRSSTLFVNVAMGVRGAAEQHIL